jgi:hypothetical protein
MLLGVAELTTGLVDSREYPNVLERVWLTACPGCEFEVRGSPPYVGDGSSGASMHLISRVR